MSSIAKKVEKIKKMNRIYSSLEVKEQVLMEIYIIATLIKFGQEDGLEVERLTGVDLEGKNTTTYTIKMEHGGNS